MAECAFQRRLRSYVLLTAIFLAPTPSWATDNSPWPTANFIAANKRLCPRIDLSALTDASFSTEAFHASNWLSPRSQRDVDMQIKAECASEIGGFYCESFIIVRNLDQSHLTHRFVRHLCRRYTKCSEPAAC
jgi:NADH:ubiquinone oxidoreductase subunit B-like Fe-S oxidoreductase